MSRIDQLIAEARLIIKNDQEQHIKPIFLEAEQFLVDNKIPVKPYYENYWKYEAYPMFRFNQFTNVLKDDFLPKSEKLELFHYVYKHMYMLNYNNYSIVVFSNVFGTSENTEHKFRTYEEPARLNKDLMMTYIHPKYMLEEILRKMCSPSADLASLGEKKKELIEKWASLEPDAKLDEEVAMTEPAFVKSQYRMIKYLDKHMISASYDPSIPIYIGSSASIMEFEKYAKSEFLNLKVTKNSSKSFFDLRTNNYIFKNGGFILAKIWELTDHELIPVLPYGSKRKAHISVLLRLALTENITYEILGFDNIATEKLTIFKSILTMERNLIQSKAYIEVSKCKYIGQYFPIEKYIAMMRSHNHAKKQHAK